MWKRLFSWKWFVQIPDAGTQADVARWWKERRLTYNFWVGAVGIVTWFSVLIAGGNAVKPGVDFEEPFAMFLGPPIYALMANVCYSGGSIVDRLLKNRQPSRGLMLVGFGFSLLLTALPGLWAIYCWIRAVRTGVLMD